MPRTVCLMAFSYEPEETEEKSRYNRALAEEAKNAYNRFLFDNREENNLRLIVVAQQEIANILEEYDVEVDIPIGWLVTPEEKLTAAKLMNQALSFTKNSAVKEVILIAPFWKMHTFRRLTKKAGLIPVKMKIKRIGLWPASPNWWRNSLVRLLFRSLTRIFRD